MQHAKDYVIITELAMCENYEVSAPRADQAKERAVKLSQELTGLFNNIGQMLTTDPEINNPAIFATCSILDDKCFVMPAFLFEIEYKRVEFDSFGRIKNVNESKAKHLWLSYIIFKLFLFEFFPKMEAISGVKFKRPNML